MNPSDTNARAHGACAAVRLTQSDAEHGCGEPMNPLDGVTGFDLALLPLVEEFMMRIESDRWLDVAFARFERGDIEGGWRALEAASHAAQALFADMINSYEGGR